MKNCMKCNQMIADEAIFCPYCGSEQRAVDKTEEFVFCPYCGNKIKKNLSFCTNCGKKLGNTGAAPGVWEDPGYEEPGDDSPAYQDPGYEEPSERWGDSQPRPQSEAEVPFMLKIAGVIFGAIYVIFALIYFPYLGYSYAGFKLVGLLQIVAYAWSALILFLLAMKGQRENGIYLLAGLFLGTIVASVMHIMNLALSSSHHGYGNGGIGRFIFTLIVAAVITYIMYNEHLLMPMEYCGGIGDILRTMPGIVVEMLPKKGSIRRPGKVRTEYETGAGYGYDYSGSARDRLASVGGSIWSLIFCIVFTLNLFLEMFENFTLISLVGYSLSLVLCAGMWCVFVSCKTGKMVSTGFTMISVIATIELVIQCIWAVFLLWLAVQFVKEDEAMAGLFVLVFAALMVIYWISLRRTAHSAAIVAKGRGSKLHASLYPVVILCISAVWRTLMLAVANYIQQEFGSLLSGIGSLGSLFSNWLDAAGELGSYGYSSYYSSYGYDSYSNTFSLLKDVLEFVVNWLQSTLGLQDNIFMMILGIAIPVCCVGLLLKIRHAGNGG